MNAAVFDTSALLRLFIPDGPVPEGAERALRAAARGTASLLIPELALAEAGQVLHKEVMRRVLRQAEAVELLQDLLDLPLQLFSHKPLLPRALELAQELDVTVYDTLFLALAEKYDASLITADEEMRKAAARLSLGPD
jgi:predicted nucleic acid-binding protein